MFLRPVKPKVLRIVDSIIHREEECTITDGGNTKLVFSYGPKKPNLGQISIQQWLLANIVFFIIYWQVKSFTCQKIFSIT